jgi:thymidylate synthase
MKAYLDIVQKVLETGVRKQNRTGIDTLAIAGAMFEHDMADGFPLITTKQVPFRLVATELQFFIGGHTDKKWLQDRNNHIWDEWCCPFIVPYGHDQETKDKMRSERDLGPVYGWQWRHFGASYSNYISPAYGIEVDQLAALVKQLKTNPYDRRMIVTAWNPCDLDMMALPPCHYAFQVTVIEDRLNLLWNQRSVDVALGLPFDIALYGLLLHLLAAEVGLREGKLVGFLADTHIYVNHIDGLKEQLLRQPHNLPRLSSSKFESIFEWIRTDTTVVAYNHHPRIQFEVAV